MSWLSRWTRRAPRLSAPLVLYTRRACPLCDEMKVVLARAGAASGWSEVDVDSDPALARALGDQVPVLEVGGRIAFRARIREEGLARRLARLEKSFHLRGPGPGAARALEASREER